jgi:hypothetical protein
VRPNGIPATEQDSDVGESIRQLVEDFPGLRLPTAFHRNHPVEQIAQQA